MKLNPEVVAYWYFRLNGFFTFQNFILHPDRGTRQHTDADILGIRFPHRAELCRNPMTDDKMFTRIADVPFIVMAEVKKGRCSLNDAWTKPESKNIQRVLRAIGAIPVAAMEAVSSQIYDQGYYRDASYYISLCCIGDEIDSDVQKRYPEIPQITWNDALRFIFSRFRIYRSQKGEHEQWDDSGHVLWKCAAFSTTEEDFIKDIAKLWMLI